VLHTYLREFQIGTVAHAYDSPSVDRTYPNGYQHDLALITGPKLPRFSQPPDCAKLTDMFGRPEQALKAGTVFQLFSGFRRPKPDVVPNRDALIIRTQSLWNYTEYLHPVSLIWPSHKGVCSGSGSLLCLGSHANARTTGLVLENFVGHFASTPWRKDDTELTGFPEVTMFKGGFFLPDEMRNGTIILDDEEETRRVLSDKCSEASSQIHGEAITVTD
jgi:hypothetical protein